MIFRVHWYKLGIHVHAKIYAGEIEHALGMAGELTFREAEWEVFMRTVVASAYLPSWQFIEDEQTVAVPQQSAALKRFNERRAAGIPIGGPDERKKRKRSTE